MNLRPTGVYVQTNENGHITDIGSDLFLPSLDGWQRIDEGFGERYDHAQGQYLPQPVHDEDGRSNWKLVGGEPVMRTDAEKAADPMPEVVPALSGDAESRIAELERLIAAQDQQIAMLLEGVTEDE